MKEYRVETYQWVELEGGYGYYKYEFKVIELKGE